MARALWNDSAAGRPAGENLVDWKKRMSDHIAAALLIYTGLHIFVTMKSLNSHGDSILPYFGLVFLVGAVIPACRLFEKRWERLVASGAPDGELRGLFRRDLVVLWGAALSLPLIVTGLVKVILALT